MRKSGQAMTVCMYVCTVCMYIYVCVRRYICIYVVYKEPILRHRTAQMRTSGQAINIDVCSNVRVDICEPKPHTHACTIFFYAGM